jgi:hydrogenase maturation protease
MSWLVVGFGSDLGGDDRFGLCVAQAVSQAVAERSIDATVLALRTLGPELVEKIPQSSGVVFVDASVEVLSGAFSIIDLRNSDLTPARSAGAGKHNPSPAMGMSHYCDPAALVQLTATLYGDTPPAWLLVGGGVNFALSEKLSPELTVLIPQVTQRILDLISDTPD